MTGARRLLVVAAAACLGIAALLAPPAVDRGDGVAAAIGRSMGGVRVMVIDGLFLRAEAERKAGRVEEAAALYESVLELDPANEAAVMFLSNVYVDELMPQVPDVEGRFQWWREARALTLRALGRHPDSAALQAHACQLILAAPRVDQALVGLLEAELERPRLVALRHLRAAVRGAETLPRQGRSHLTTMTVLAPLVAAEGLRDRRAGELAEGLAAGREALRLRGDVLRTMRSADLEVDLRRLLELGLEAVEAVRDVRLRGADPRRAVGLVLAYREALPDSGLPDVLREILTR